MNSAIEEITMAADGRRRMRDFKRKTSTSQVVGRWGSCPSQQTGTAEVAPLSPRTDTRLTPMAHLEDKLQSVAAPAPVEAADRTPRVFSRRDPDRQSC